MQVLTKMQPLWLPGFLVLKMTFWGISRWHIMDMDWIVCPPPGSATCPPGRFVSILCSKAPFCMGLLLARKFVFFLCSASLLAPFYPSNTVIRWDLKKGRTASDSVGSLRRLVVLLFPLSQEGDPSIGLMAW